MTATLGKNLLAFFGLTNVGAAQGTVSIRSVRAPQAYKSAGYASVPYERAPKITDSVPTKYSDGTPFWADYVTPNNDWSC